MALGKENEAFDLINEKQARSQETQEPSRQSKVEAKAQRHWGGGGYGPCSNTCSQKGCVLYNKVGPP